MSTNSRSNPNDDSGERNPTNGGNSAGHPHRLRRDRTGPKRVHVRPVALGQFREVLAKLTEPEAEILRFKWGLHDGQAHSASSTAEKFAVGLEVISELESRALDMVSEL